MAPPIVEDIIKSHKLYPPPHFIGDYKCIFVVKYDKKYLHFIFWLSIF